MTHYIPLLKLVASYWPYNPAIFQGKHLEEMAGIFTELHRPQAQTERNLNSHQRFCIWNQWKGKHWLGGHKEFSVYLQWKDPPFVWVVPSGGSPDEGEPKRKHCLLPACPLLLTAAPAAFLQWCLTSFSSHLTKSEDQQLSRRTSGLQHKTGNETSGLTDQKNSWILCSPLWDSHSWTSQTILYKLVY